MTSDCLFADLKLDSTKKGENYSLHNVILIIPISPHLKFIFTRVEFT